MERAAILLSLTILAGCVGGGDDVAPAGTQSDETAPSSQASPTPGTPASPSSPPSTKPTATPTAPGTNASDNETVESVPVPYAWSSALPPEVCAPAPTLGCAGLVASEGWWDRLGLDGAATRAKLDLTWTVSAGGVERMHFALVRAKPCEGDGCWSGEAIASIEGVSPLALDTDVPALDEDEFLVVVALATSLVPDPLFGFAHTEQPFEVAGEFIVAS